MNHPKREEWVPYLFGEAKLENRDSLRKHLHGCPACRGEVESWKRSLGRLNAWRLPRAHRPRETSTPLLKWAMAAAVVVVLGLGFVLGRFASSKGEVARWRAAIEPQIRQQLQFEVARMVREETARVASATLAASGEQTTSWLAEHARAVEAKIENERIERIADCLSLKKDIDTIAVNADAGLRHAEQRLTALADYSPPTGMPNPPENSSSHN